MGMPKIVFDLALFNSSEPREIKRSRRVLLWLLEALVQINILWLRTHPDTPLLYKAGVKYVPEALTENWRDIPNIISRKEGDCEDLAAWRVAELRLLGINARPYIRWRKVGDTMRYHALVLLPDNRVEDPSEALGMYDVMHLKPVYV